MPKDKKKPNPKHAEAAQLKEQVSALTNALQLERADATNIRRQHEQQLASLQSYAKAQIVKDLLPVIDNIERAMLHVPDDIKGNDFVKGVNGVAQQFYKVLKDMGVERIKTVGEAFDPNVHEAVSVEEGDENSHAPSIEVVCEELQSGYMLSGDILRPAMVKVKHQQQEKDNKHTNK